MFTGIVSDIGEVVAREDGCFSIRSRYPAGSLDVGASMACDGCCLTMTSVRPEGEGSVFTVDTSNETRAKTTIADWRAGRRGNLERSLQVGAELGGHHGLGPKDGTSTAPPASSMCGPMGKAAASPSRCRITWRPTSHPKARSRSTGSP